ncbi:MAG: hypothetical protein ACODAJ_09690, partial [Planctomycetota bacterium]
TSLAVPASFDQDRDPGPAAPNARCRLRPGVAGYQQHLWHAALGRGCHVFVNHPGASTDLSKSRPGYWYGNGSVPRLHQQEAQLTEIFDIPDDHPMPFTHAHWPADAFDEQEVSGHWAFGRRGEGGIALWCSQPLEPHDEVLTGRELRAWGRRVAWLCFVGRCARFGRFIEGVREAAPTFEARARRVAVAGRTIIRWEG